MRISYARKAALLGTALLLTCVVGCGGSGTVSGKISYKDKPLPVGVIYFKSESGKAVSGPIKDGSYRVENVPAGTAKIGIELPILPTDSKGFGIKGGPPPGAKIGPPKGVTVAEGFDAKGFRPSSPYPPGFQFPNHYRDPETSKLTYTVTSGDQQHDINLD
jgi:hypothetical protein